MPAVAASETTARQASCARAITSTKNGAVTRATRPGSSAYASVIRLRNRARMMQPPRQILAMSPFLMSQSYCAAPATIASKPCEYAMTFEA